MINLRREHYNILNNMVTTSVELTLQRPKARWLSLRLQFNGTILAITLAAFNYLIDLSGGEH